MEKEENIINGEELPENIALLSPEERRKWIIELRRRGYTYRQIAKMLRVSFRDISRALGNDQRDDDVFLVFRELEKGRSLPEIVIRHKIPPERVENIARQYAALKNIDVSRLADLEKRVKRLEDLVSSTFEEITCKDCGFTYLAPKIYDEWICPCCGSARMWRENYIPVLRPKAPKEYKLRTML